MNELFRLIPPEVIAAVLGVLTTLLGVWWTRRTEKKAQQQVVDVVAKRAAHWRKVRLQERLEQQKRADEKTAAVLKHPSSADVATLISEQNEEDE